MVSQRRRGIPPVPKNYPDMTQDVTVTRIAMPEMGLMGIATMQVCAYGEVLPETVEKRANELNPSGVSSDWKIVWGTDDEDPMNNANKAPTACAEVPGRLHYLLTC